MPCASPDLRATAHAADPWYLAKACRAKSDLGRPLPKASNSSRIRAQVTQNRNRKNYRNVAYKTHSKERDKKRLTPAKKTLVSKSDLGRPLPKASNSSRIRAQVTQNRNRKNCRNVAYKTHSKERDKKRLTPAKKTLVSKSDLGRPLPKASNSSRIRAQVSRIRAQVTQNRNRQKCRNVAYRTHSKERDKKRIPPAKKTLVSKSDLGRPLPKASNSSRIRAQVTQNRNRKNCRNVAYKTHSKERDKKRLTPAKKTLVSKSDLGRPLPKASNSSRIRAQVTQNRNRQKCRNVAYRTHSKERDKKRIPPAKKTLVSKSDLGRPLPKASNSSRIRAQVTQNQEKIASSKENLSLEIWPWKTASESLKQQQDSSPSPAKPQPQKLPKRRLQNPFKRKRQEKIASSKENLSLEIWPWKTASESLKQQQDSSPSHAKPQTAKTAATSHTKPTQKKETRKDCLQRRKP